MPHPDFARCARHLTADAVRELLSEMVDIPSPTGGEADMARYMVERMGRAGLKTRLQEVDPGRPNAIGSREGAGDGVNLLFTGHMDTSYDGDEDYLTGEGFKPKAVYRDGWLWGLGANNMKSGTCGRAGGDRGHLPRGYRLARGHLARRSGGRDRKSAYR